MKTIGFTLYMFFHSIVLFGQSFISEPFDKEKWLISSTYRYDLILRSYEVIAPLLNHRTEAELTSLLGQPFERRVRMNSPVHKKDGWISVEEVVDLTYCLDLEANLSNDVERTKVCKGSSITFHFYQNENVDVTISQVD
ncbi:MAG: hypothetical protein GC178_16375 [Flavobacteriales bacterium]|nr:hypothetical protein [Flavobacteriales bacterium]